MFADPVHSRDAYADALKTLLPKLAAYSAMQIDKFKKEVRFGRVFAAPVKGKKSHRSTHMDIFV